MTAWSDSEHPFLLCFVDLRLLESLEPEGLLFLVRFIGGLTPHAGPLRVEECNIRRPSDAALSPYLVTLTWLLVGQYSVP